VYKLTPEEIAVVRGWGDLLLDHRCRSAVK
jgi:hypothetical protein